MSDPIPPEPKWPATFDDGAQALAMSWDGALLMLACDRAHPPGRPLELTLELASGAVTLRGKSAGSKRREDQRFDVRVRLHSLRRSDREQLDTAFGRSSAGGVAP